MDDIKLIKLITGEDIVASVTITESQESETLWNLENAAKLILAPDGLGMMPLAPFSKSNVITIRESHVVFSTEIDDDIKNVYKEKFGNGIVVTSSPSLELFQ